jgi:hypothetical protein
MLPEKFRLPLPAFEALTHCKKKGFKFEIM